MADQRPRTPGNTGPKRSSGTGSKATSSKATSSKTSGAKATGTARKASTSRPSARKGATTKGATGKKTKRGRKRSRIGTILARTAAVLGIIALVVALVLAGVGIWFYKTTDLPDPNSDFNTNTTFIYYGDGTTKLGNFAVQNRQSVTYGQMNQFVKDAVVAAENRDFWTDPGISVSGIARSLFSIAKGGEVQGGGSTITQQYIKIYYLNSDRTISRKLRELVLAIKMGREKPKQDILRDYLNTIYFGRGAYGIQAASRSYFLTDAKNLTLPQAAVLASVLNNPSLFDPSDGARNKQRLLDRYHYVLDGMLSAQTITKAQYDQAYPALPNFPEVPINKRFSGPNGYLMKMVQDELLNRGFSEAQIQGGGLQVTTTFNKTLQDQAVKVAQSYTKKIAADAEPKQKADALHVAISSVDVRTGGVLALYGGADYIANSRNWSTTPRPAASTMKAYAAMAGLRNGFSLRSRFNGDTFTPKGDSVSVRNEFNEQYGEVSLMKATADSINTAFVDMTQQIPNGPQQVIKAANDAGVPAGDGWDPNNRIALGTAEVSPLDNATGFATIVNQGKYNANHVVAQVKDISGRVLYTAKAENKQSVEPEIAADTTHALKSVVEQGTGSSVSDLGVEIAGKTGTSGVGDKITSAWFTAATRQVSTAVMYVAGDGGNGDLDPYKRPGDGTFFGGTYPAQTWADYMRVAIKQYKDEPLAEPDWVNLSGKSFGQHRSQPSETSEATRSSSSTTNPSSSTTSSASSSASATASGSTSASEQPTRTSQVPSTSAEPTRTASTEPSSRPSTTTTRPSQTSTVTSGPTQTSRHTQGSREEPKATATTRP